MFWVIFLERKVSNLGYLKSATHHFLTMKGVRNFVRADTHVALATESCVFISFNRISFIQAHGNWSYDHFQHFCLQYNRIYFQLFASEIPLEQVLITFFLKALSKYSFWTREWWRDKVCFSCLFSFSIRLKYWVTVEMQILCHCSLLYKLLLLNLQFSPPFLFNGLPSTVFQIGFF